MECNINLEPLFDFYFNGKVLHFNRCKLNGVKPAMWVLKTKIGAIHNIEGKIAFMRNKVEFHEKKWEKIKCCLN